MDRINNGMLKVYVGATSVMKSMADKTRDFMKEERGASDILAMIIILGIVLALGFAFRTQILKLVRNLWELVTKPTVEDKNVVIPAWGNE